MKNRLVLSILIVLSPLRASWQDKGITNYYMLGGTLVTLAAVIYAAHQYINWLPKKQLIQKVMEKDNSYFSSPCLKTQTDSIWKNTYFTQFRARKNNNVNQDRFQTRIYNNTYCVTLYQSDNLINIAVKKDNLSEIIKAQLHNNTWTFGQE